MATHVTRRRHSPYTHGSLATRAASKDPELEATYLKLLKEPGTPHEKAITRDLGRLARGLDGAAIVLTIASERSPIMISSRTVLALGRRTSSTFSKPTRCTQYHNSPNDV